MNATLIKGKDRRLELIDYYRMLCPSENEWVHEQLANERFFLEERIQALMGNRGFEAYVSALEGK